MFSRAGRASVLVSSRVIMTSRMHLYIYLERILTVQNAGIIARGTDEAFLDDELEVAYGVDLHAFVRIPLVSPGTP